MNWNYLFLLGGTLSVEICLTVGALVVLAVDLALQRGASRQIRVTVATLISAVAILVAADVHWEFLNLGPSGADAELVASEISAELAAETAKAIAGTSAAHGLAADEILAAAKMPKFDPDLSTAWAKAIAETSAAYGLAAGGGVVAGKMLVLLLGLLSFGISWGTSRLKNPAEHAALTLFALAGLSLMCAAENLLLIFAALELASLSLYVLAGFDKTRPESAEAGLKYFLFGGTAAAFLLFGFSLFYGFTGTLSLTQIGANLGAAVDTPLILIASLMVLAGFGYKAAAAPFHLWAPDTYEGAPVASGALIASASKVGGFILLARFLGSALATPGILPPGTPDDVAAALPPLIPNNALMLGLIVAIVASLLIGNIAALAQRGVRRLLAYSAIAHAGVLLLCAWNTAAAAGADAKADAAFLDLSNLQGGLPYYLLAYGLANIGAFGVVAILENHNANVRHGGGGVVKIHDLAGLWRRSPFLGACLAVFVLSLSGVPPLAGFFAKFFVFTDAIRLAGNSPSGDPRFWLTLLAIAMSAVALYYYLQILKAVFVASPESAAAAATPESGTGVSPASSATDAAAAPATAKIRIHPATAVTLAFAALAILLLGICPSLLGSLR